MPRAMSCAASPVRSSLTLPCSKKSRPSPSWISISSASGQYVTVFVIRKSPGEDGKDFAQRIIDEVSRFTSLRYGDFKDVVYISAEGTERSCQMAACAKYTYGELI